MFSSVTIYQSNLVVCAYIPIYSMLKGAAQPVGSLWQPDLSTNSVFWNAIAMIISCTHIQRSWRSCIIPARFIMWAGHRIILHVYKGWRSLYTKYKIHILNNKVYHRPHQAQIERIFVTFRIQYFAVQNCVTRLPLP